MATLTRLYENYIFDFFVIKFYILVAPPGEHFVIVKIN